jgi:hypothetical protein
VLVRGPAHEVTDPDEFARLRGLRLRPWANDGADHFIAIDIELLSGRRVIQPHVDPPESASHQPLPC